MRGSAWTRYENSDMWDAEDVQEVALMWKRDGVAQEPEAVEIAEYQSDEDDDDFRAEVDFDALIFAELTIFE